MWYFYFILFLILVFYVVMFGFEVISGDMFIIVMEKVKFLIKFNVFINLIKSYLKINDFFLICSCVVLLLNICIVF